MIQNLRELLQANYTKHTFKFRQSSRIDSLIKYWREGEKGGGGGGGGLSQFKDNGESQREVGGYVLTERNNVLVFIAS